MLRTNEADLALTLWPAKYWNTNRSDALSKLCPRSSTGRCVSIVGVHGYRARSGWFVTASSPEVRGNLVAWSTITSLLANTSTSKNETTPFARKLTKAHELKVTDLCDTYENLSEMRHSGRFNWLLIDPNPSPCDHPAPNCPSSNPTVILTLTLTPIPLPRVPNQFRRKLGVPDDSICCAPPHTRSFCTPPCTRSGVRHLISDTQTRAPLLTASAERAPARL